MRRPIRGNTAVNYNKDPGKYWWTITTGGYDNLGRVMFQKEFPNLKGRLLDKRLDLLSPKYLRNVGNSIYRNALQRKLYWQTIVGPNGSIYNESC